jgi:hypothetical protein
MNEKKNVKYKEAASTSKTLVILFEISTRELSSEIDIQVLRF